MNNQSNNRKFFDAIQVHPITLRALSKYRSKNNDLLLLMPSGRFSAEETLIPAISALITRSSDIHILRSNQSSEDLGVNLPATRLAVYDKKSLSFGVHWDSRILVAQKDGSQASILKLLWRQVGVSLCDMFMPQIEQCGCTKRKGSLLQTARCVERLLIRQLVHPDSSTPYDNVSVGQFLELFNPAGREVLGDSWIPAVDETEAFVQAANVVTGIFRRTVSYAVVKACELDYFIPDESDFAEFSAMVFKN